VARSGGRGLVSRQSLERFKYEVAEELGLTPRIHERGWGEMPSRDCGAVGGRIGGNMVKVMVRYAEQMLAQGEAPE